MYCWLLLQIHPSFVLEGNICETSLKGSRYESAHHFHVGLAIKSLCKDGHHKHIDEERDEESDGGLNEVVLVGLLHLLLVCSIYVS